MFDVLHELENLLQDDAYLVILPVSRLVLESPFRVGEYRFFPAGSLDLNKLELEPPLDLNGLWGNNRPGVLWLEGEDLRKAAASLTEATIEIFESNAAIVFVPKTDLNLGTTYDDDLRLLVHLSQTAERAMDRIRFDFCRFDLPDTLPGTAGTWSGSNAFCCAIVYDRSNRTARLLAGESLMHSTVSKGTGLELWSSQCASADDSPLPTPSDGEVGGIACHALRLFSDVMNSNTNTSKFLRAMTLLEFLASPFSFQKFQDGKRNVIAHLTQSCTMFDLLLDRFRQYSDKKDTVTGQQTGYRTLMIHHGRFLEDILSNPSEQTALFRELQQYTAKVIYDLMERRTDRWIDVVQYRKQRKDAIQLQRNHSH